MLVSRRRGVSLLEVTFAIGVVMIGLVGIASLLPLGGALARKGAIADAAAQLGANVTREFTARGMAIPQNWRWFNSSVGQFTNVVLANGTTPQPGMSFCLDPILITAVDPASPHYANEMAARARFPLNALFDPSILPMPRITLRNPLLPTAVLDATAANSLFVGTDDLVFDLPVDRTLGPVQNFSFLNAVPANPLKRNSQGRISWMATIVPKLDRLASSTGTLPPTHTFTNDYTLSVVLFSQRPVDRELIDTTSGSPVSEDVVNERVGTVAQFYSGSATELDPAFSGGDVTLATRNGRGPDDLELRSGDWLMFSGQKMTYAGAVQVHKWYRIVHAGEDPQPTGALWTRDVTVVGPDWNIPLTQFTMVRGVIQVLERTIRLETSSMWTN